MYKCLTQLFNQRQTLRGRIQMDNYAPIHLFLYVLGILGISFRGLGGLGRLVNGP
jgi:hypothetical protein